MSWHKHRDYRRHQKKLHDKRLERIADYAGYLGPYISDCKGRVINPGRGSASRYFKNQSNRTVRREKFDKEKSYGGRNYNRRVYDYWWMLT